MFISLVQATLNRTKELDDFIRHLVNQTYTKYELIIVDQNQDDRLVPIMKKYDDIISIIHLKHSKGLSRSRNYGIKYAKGEIIAFPDDDCWYDVNVLSEVATFFKSRVEASGVIGQAIYEGDKPIGIKYKKLNQYSIMNYVVSWTIFIKKDCFDTIGDFNEKLGLGSGTRTDSGEELDLLARVIKKYIVFYNSSIKVYHPQMYNKTDGLDLNKICNYHLGQGFVFQLNNYPYYFYVYRQLRSIIGILIALFKVDLAKIKFYQKCIIGRAQGWIYNEE